MRADRAGDLSDRDLGGRGGEPLTGSTHLVDEVGELHPEGQGLGVHAVGPAHHHGEAVAFRLLDQRPDEQLDIGIDHAGGIAKLGREGRVDDVGRRQPEVEIAAGVADRLLHRGDERGDVMPLFGLELGDPLGVNGGSLQGGQCLDRNAADLRPPFACEQLDVQPALQAR